MELLDEESHRLLLWAVRLNEVGSSPTAEELHQLSQPRRPAAETVVRSLTGRATEYAEDTLASLIRRALVEHRDDGTVVATELGRTVVNALGLHPDDTPLFEVIEADMRSSDTLAFARVAGRLAALDRPMLVDPYCRVDQLEYLVTHTSITRVLVSDRLDDGDLDSIAQLVDSIKRRPVRLRVRVAPAAAIHDRHVIDSDRVLQVASTVGAPGTTATVITEAIDAADAVRSYYRSVWRAADKLASYRPGRLGDAAA